MKVKQICILIATLYCSLNILNALINDAAVWTKVAIEKQITRRFLAQVSEELRLTDNVMHAGVIISNIYVEYKIYKELKLLAGYQFIQNRRPEETYSKRHRYYFDAIYKIKLHHVVLNLRERFQS